MSTWYVELEKQTTQPTKTISARNIFSILDAVLLFSSIIMYNDLFKGTKPQTRTFQCAPRKENVSRVGAFTVFFSFIFFLFVAKEQ
jgi:hypothetical protein